MVAITIENLSNETISDLLHSKALELQTEQMFMEQKPTLEGFNQKIQKDDQTKI